MKTNLEPEKRNWPRENAKTHGLNQNVKGRSDLVPLKSLLRSALCALCVLLWQSALAGVHYVDVNSTNATPPYTNWATAATNIQDAVDAAVAADEVVVTNGAYRLRNIQYKAVTVVDKPLSVRSVNGPQFTTIDGNSGSRCAYLTNGASLCGFTLTNGSSSLGAGVLCESATAVASNCIITGNSAYIVGIGGGAYSGTLNNCTLASNSALNGGHGGGAAYSTLNNCTLSGNSGSGAAYCTLNNCTLSGNTGLNGGYPSYQILGGGAYNSTLNNCTLSGNSADFGGGAYDCTLNNCTLTGNTADYGGGGAGSCTLSNCIVYFNTAQVGANYDSASPLNYCCTTPQPTNGFGSITNTPLFVDTNGWANLRLQPSSPCINAGNNSYVTNATDLDGNPRISGGIVDIGAYEYQWPQLTIAPSGPNVLLTWPTNNAGYDYTGFTLQSTTNLVSPVVWSTNSPAPVVIAGQNTVTSPIIGGQKFYRLVQ